MNRHDLAGKGSQWAAMRRYQIDFLLRHGLQPHHTYLDIGCGPLRGGIPVIEHLDKGNYTGVDAWAESLVEAWDELEDMELEDKEPTLIEVDVLEGQQLGFKFDVIMAFSVLHHIRDDGLGAFADFVARHLADGGTFYCTALIGEEWRDLLPWHRYPMYDRPFEDYQAAFEKGGLVLEYVETVPILHSEHIMSARRERKTT